MKIRNRISAVALSALLAVGTLAGCADNAGQQSGKTNIEFWGWGDDAEVQVFTQLVDTFNATHDDIYVNFTKRPSNTYSVDALKQLQSRRPPDVVFVGDRDIKKCGSEELDVLEDLSHYVQQSDVIDLSDIWEGQMSRFQFDPVTFENSADAPIWGLPKDLGATVIYYNKDALEKAGITVIEGMTADMVPEDEAHGFYTKDGKMYFNNSIAMTQKELVEIGKVLTQEHIPHIMADIMNLCLTIPIPTTVLRKGRRSRSTEMCMRKGRSCLIMTKHN